MRQIVYFSTASMRQNPATIAAILEASRRNNARDRVTGLLIAGGQRYLQVIEGPDLAIAALIDRIRADDRNVGVTVLVDRAVRRRDFDGWSMAYRDEPNLARFATFSELVGQMSEAVADRRLRGQVACFERTFAVTPVAPDGRLWALADRGGAV